MLRDTSRQRYDLFKQDISQCSAGSNIETGVRFRKLRTMNPFHLISASLQIVAGLCLITLAILGLITPLWVSAVMSMIGSASTVVGIFLLYDTTRERKSVENLARDSIRRIIKEQN